MSPGDRQQPERERVEARERHVACAEHQRHDEVRKTREGRDHEQEDHQRGVDGEEAVVRLRVEELNPRPRELRAYQHCEQPAGEEEEDRRREILDADHLVVGVDAEVVLPRARAVAGVVLGPRRLSERVVRPVVEGADAGEEPDRCCDEERDEDDGLPVPDRLPVAPPAEDEHDPEPDRREEDRHPGCANPARAEEEPTCGPVLSWRSVDVVFSGCRGQELAVTPSCWTGSDTGRARRAEPSASSQTAASRSSESPAGCRRSAP